MVGQSDRGAAGVTIAMCYLSQEGLVFGADSTASYVAPDGLHYLNNAQKLFEIGEDATLGLVVWGLGGLQSHSYRTLLALLADDLKVNPAPTVEAVAKRWADQFWAIYSGDLAASIARCAELNKKAAFDDTAIAPNMRTAEEEREFQQLLGLSVGFCLGGYVLPDRQPYAYVMGFEPLASKPTPTALQPVGGFWGAPNFIQRLIFGWDERLRDDILASNKWGGSPGELDKLLSQHRLEHPTLPIRDAIDFVHACIHSTIKAHKFSNLSQICGGPIEIAVIRTDRRFRWVRHKGWDAAITEGANDESRREA
jgi:hypothetical protein